MLASTLVLTLTVAVLETVPPGPVDFEVVSGWSPSANALRAAGRDRSDVADIRVNGFRCLPRRVFEVSPQLIWPAEAEKLPVTGATAIVALAVPGLNLGRSFSLVPRVHSVVFWVFFAMSTEVFLLAWTSTSPSQTVLPSLVTVR